MIGQVHFLVTPGLSLKFLQVEVGSYLRLLEVPAVLEAACLMAPQQAVHSTAVGFSEASRRISLNKAS